MNRNLLVAIIVLALGAGFLVVLSLTQKKEVPIKPQPTLAPTQSPTPTPRQLTVSLSQENASGETGIATITESNGKVMVSVVLSGAPSGVSQPAHIHLGKCPNPGAIKYPLTSLVDGKSDTTLDGVTSIDALLAQVPLAINVHKSTAAPSIYVACGDIKADISPAMSGSVMPLVSGTTKLSPTSSHEMTVTTTPTKAAVVTPTQAR